MSPRQLRAMAEARNCTVVIDGDHSVDWRPPSGFLFKRGLSDVKMICVWRDMEPHYTTRETPAKFRDRAAAEFQSYPIGRWEWIPYTDEKIGRGVRSASSGAGQ